MELCDRSACELAEMLKNREVSSREITESVFKRIDKKEDTIHAYITTTRETALKQNVSKQPLETPRFRR